VSGGHYTATVEVRETIPARSTSTTGGYRQPTETKTEREVRDVARVVVRADSIERLREKLAAHVALID
jgi:hypothetical protein